MIKVRLIISGRVQGVFFRQFVYEQSQKFDSITGFVRNLYSGEVEVLAFHKDRNILKELIRLCHQGSPTSHVSNIKEEWGETSDESHEFDEFTITQTI
ncbi:MAG: acylphosphatase [Candidatus Hodarchaeales archaeon]